MKPSDWSEPVDEPVAFDGGHRLIHALPARDGRVRWWLQRGDAEPVLLVELAPGTVWSVHPMYGFVLKEGDRLSWSTWARAPEASPIPSPVEALVDYVRRLEGQVAGEFNASRDEDAESEAELESHLATIRTLQSQVVYWKNLLTSRTATFLERADVLEVRVASLIEAGQTLAKAATAGNYLTNCGCRDCETKHRALAVWKAVVNG